MKDGDDRDRMRGSQGISTMPVSILLNRRVGLRHNSHRLIHTTNLADPQYTVGHYSKERLNDYSLEAAVALHEKPV